MARIWEDKLSDTDRLVITRGGYGKSRGLGERPLLLIIDVQYNYVGEDLPIAEQLDRWPSGGGAVAWQAVRHIATLREAARQAGIPIFYSRNVQKQTLAFDLFQTKTVRDQSKYLEGRPETQIVKELEPAPGELVIDKSYASLFYGTPFLSYLVKLRVDTLLITGGSTSGCVRATAVDAATRNFNVAVVEECVYDRIELSHKASLLDLWMKYCDVISLEEALHYLRQLKRV
ncbi:MAG: isochorismatase family protein [Clostridia bacterium]|nr:isochorismatase family protein [Clostridia bacterium]MBC7346272.1 isochorismatase family protein [Clostridia bacterium]